MRPHVPPIVPPAFVAMTQALQLPPALVRKLWRAMEQLALLDSQAQTFRYHIERLTRLDDQSAAFADALGRFLRANGGPRHVAMLVEKLQVMALLPRREASVVQEAILDRTTAQGQWR